MTKYITLLGTEQVQRAASQMVQAAETMRQQAGFLSEMLDHKLQRAEELVSRLEALQEAADDANN